VIVIVCPGFAICKVVWSGAVKTYRRTRHVLRSASNLVILRALRKRAKLDEVYAHRIWVERDDELHTRFWRLCSAACAGTENVRNKKSGSRTAREIHRVDRCRCRAGNRLRIYITGNYQRKYEDQEAKVPRVVRCHVQWVLVSFYAANPKRIYISAYFMNINFSQVSKL
jgi:hypothetical protein